MKKAMEWLKGLVEFAVYCRAAWAEGRKEREETGAAA